MLSRRLTVPVIAATTLLAAACGKPIEKNVVRPGITALDESQAAACGANAAILRTAIDSYEVLNGEPPTDEAALVDAGLLREETTDWDVVDGEVVAENPECGPVVTPTTVEIVTEPSPTDAGTSGTGPSDTGAPGLPSTTDGFYALFDAEFIAAVGGPACARELAVIGAAGERYTERNGTEPPDLDALRDDLDEPVVFYTYDTASDALVPVDGSPCNDPNAGG